MLKVIIFLLAVFGLFSFGVFTFDFILLLKKKLSHRQVICWKDREAWEKAVVACGAKWSNNPPTVPLKDEERLVVIDVLMRQYKVKSTRAWQRAQLVSGLGVNGVHTKGSSKNWLSDGMEIDNGYAIYHSWRTGMITEEEALALMEKFLKIVDKRTKENGLIEYREGFGDVRIVDTIAFVCPALVRYGIKTGKRSYVDLAMGQIRHYYQNAYLEKYGLYAHGYDSVTGTPCESIGWGRGTGWYLLGVLYCYQEMDNGEEKMWLYQRMVEAANNILKYQRADGGWSTQLIGNWNYDSSATAIFGTFLYQVYAIVNDEAYWEAAERASVRLMAATRRDGAIEFCEGDCHGVGRYSTRYSISPFTQGMTMEMIAVRKNIRRDI